MDQSSPRILRIAVGTTNPSKIKAVEQAIRHILRQKQNQSNHSVVVELDICGYNVESNVSEQPWDDDETKSGAMNRARNAYYYHQQQQQQKELSAARVVDEQLLPHLAIGIEGGLEWGRSNNVNDQKSIDTYKNQSQHRQLFCMAWIAIFGRRTEWTTEIFGASVKNHTSNSHQEYNHQSKEEVYGFSKTAMFVLPPSLSELVEQGIELGAADDMLFRRTNSKQASGTIGLLTNSLIDRSTYYEHAIQLAIIPWIHPNLYPNGWTHAIRKE
jgi:inosine/xanthosine triphosphatase